MREMNGLEASRRMRGQQVETPILALTADPPESERRACLEAGMNGLIANPCDEEAFRQAIDTVLGRNGRNGNRPLTGGVL